MRARRRKAGYSPQTLTIRRRRISCPSTIKGTGVGSPTPPDRRTSTTRSVAVRVGMTFTLLGLAAPAVRADILYVANPGTETIMKFTADGVASVFANIDTGGLHQPNGLAFDSAGNLYVSNLTSNSI